MKNKIPNALIFFTAGFMLSMSISSFIEYYEQDNFTASDILFDAFLIIFAIFLMIIGFKIDSNKNKLSKKHP